eukprot:5134130-Prymnesium_polylepis.1
MGWVSASAAEEGSCFDATGRSTRPDVVAEVCSPPCSPQEAAAPTRRTGRKDWARPPTSGSQLRLQ